MEQDEEPNRNHDHDGEENTPRINRLEKSRRPTLGDDRHDDSFRLNQEPIEFSPSPTVKQGDSETDGSLTRTAIRVKANHHGRYNVLRPHSQGGLGLVSVAMDGELNREVALKEIRPDRIANSEDVHRFLFEGELTGLLEHPGIVPVYGMGRTRNGRPFYAMRLIRGHSLRQEVRSFHQREKKSASEKLLWLRKMVSRFVQVCRTLEYAHSKGILHRDLKPSNIMLGDHGETLVVDWGLAKKLGDSETEDCETTEATHLEPTHETALGTIVGTPTYMSPEQANGSGKMLSSQSDVFGLGATLFAVCSGNSPFEGYAENELLEAVRCAEVRSLGVTSPWVPKPLRAICHKAMARSPKDRYLSAEELAVDLELWLAGEEVAAYKEDAIERMFRFARNHRESVAAAMFIVTVATIGSFIIAGMLAAKNRAIQVAEKTANLNLGKAEAAIQELELQNAATLAAQDKAATSRDLAQKTVMSLIDEIDKQDLLGQKNSKTTEIIDGASLVLKEMHALEPDSRKVSLSSARVEHYAGNLNRAEQNFDVALTHYQTARTLFRELEEGLTERERRFTALLLLDFGEFEKSQGRLNSSEEILNAGFRLVDVQSDDEGMQKAYDSIKGRITASLYSLAGHLCDYELALKMAEESLEEVQKTVQSPEASLTDFQYLLVCFTYKMRTLMKLNRLDEASQVAQEVRHVVEKEVYWADAVASVSTQYNMGSFVNVEAKLAELHKDWQKVQELGEESVELASEAHAITNNSVYLPIIAEGYRLQSIAAAEEGEMNEAKAKIDKARELLDEMTAKVNFVSDLELASQICLQEYLLADDAEKKMKAKTEAIRWMQEARTKTPESEYLKRKQADLLGRLGAG